MGEQNIGRKERKFGSWPPFFGRSVRENVLSDEAGHENPVLLLQISFSPSFWQRPFKCFFFHPILTGMNQEQVVVGNPGKNSGMIWGGEGQGYYFPIRCT
jgi:hypothetical protein